MSWKWATVLLLALGAGGGFGGCGSRRTTDTPRSASEQILVSAAIARAVSQFNFQPMTGLKVFVADAMVDRIDKSFVTASVRAAAWKAGCVVVDQADQAEFVIELRSGAVGLDTSEYVLGIPATAVPSPIGAAALPEVSLFKTVNQKGASWIAFVVYRRPDRLFQYAGGPAFGFSRQRSWWFIGAGPNISDDLTDMERQAALEGLPARPLRAAPPTQPATQPAPAPQPASRPVRRPRTRG